MWNIKQFLVAKSMASATSSVDISRFIELMFNLEQVELVQFLGHADDERVQPTLLVSGITVFYLSIETAHSEDECGFNQILGNGVVPSKSVGHKFDARATVS